MIVPHPDCVLVDHSLGAVLIGRILAKWSLLKVKAAMLVAPAETTSGDRIGHSDPIPARSLGVLAMVVASRNDP